MKKLLLLSLALCIVGFAVAQRDYNVKAEFKATAKTAILGDKVGIEPLQNLAITGKKFVPPSNKNTRDLTIFEIGHSANAYGYGYAGGQKTILWYDPDINTFVNLHRETAATYSGNLALDISYDGGQTFENDVRLYESNQIGGEYHTDAARYPQGAIYNPPGNTDPANAYYTYFVPTLDGSNSADSWGGYGYGVANMVNHDDTTKHLRPSDPLNGIMQYIPDGFHMTTLGTAVVTDFNQDWSSGSLVYLQELLINTGTFNADENDFEYDGSLPFSEGGLYPQLYKTTDGGESWEDPIYVELSGPDGISEIVYDYLTDAEIEEMFEAPVPDRDEILYTTAFDFDIVVDMYNNPHIAVCICVGGSDPYSIVTASGFPAIFDVFTFDGGDSWHAYEMGRLTTFRGTFGDLTEDNRVNASITPDGSKVFISWLDTHFEGMEDNNQPDIFCAGIDMLTNARTETINVTEFTAAWLQAYFFVAPYYVMEDDGEYIIPFTYEDMDPNDPAAAVTFNYIQDFSFSDADFTITGIGDLPVVSNDNLKVSQNYPNPFSKTSVVNVELNESANLSLEVYNLMGQKVYEINSGHVFAGTHQLNIDGNNLQSGVYFYTVKADENSVTHKMIVE